MTEIEKYVREKLFSMQDEEYRQFQSRLMPTVDSQVIIGVRTPELRSFAKEFSKNSQSKDFLDILPHKYYEENNLHAFLIERLNDYDSTIDALYKFLPYVDNWATCDMMKPKVFQKNKDKLIVEIKRWIDSADTYMVRFAIGMLMTFYLDDDFKTEYVNMVASVKSEEYYINMMIAWYFATALAKQYDNVLPYIENNTLEKWVHNKSIQKAVESRRISDEQKVSLRTLRR